MTKFCHTLTTVHEIKAGQFLQSGHSNQFINDYENWDFLISGSKFPTYSTRNIFLKHFTGSHRLTKDFFMFF